MYTMMFIYVLLWYMTYKDSILKIYAEGSAMNYELCPQYIS